MQAKENFIEREVTNIIKGAALILMFVHHFFAFPEWYIEGISYPQLKGITQFFCQPMELCVPIFAFLTGYFYFHASSKTYKYSFKKITDVWITYVVVYLLLSSIALLLGVYSFSMKNFTVELFATHREIMVFCWYVIFYVTTMLILPIYDKLSDKSSILTLFFSMLAPVYIPIFVGMTFLCKLDAVNEIVDYLRWFPCVAVGYVFAKHDLFWECSNFLKGQGKVIRILFSIVLMFVSSITRYYTINYDFLCAAMFIFGIVEFCRCVGLKKVFMPISIIGKYSLQMWFIHCIFFNKCREYTQNILFFSSNPILVTVWGLIICVAAAAIVNVPISILIKVKNKLFKFGLKS